MKLVRALSDDSQCNYVPLKRVPSICRYTCNVYLRTGNPKCRLFHAVLSSANVINSMFGRSPNALIPMSLKCVTMHF